MNVSTPWFKNSWLKSLGLKGPGLKLGVEKSRVVMSFNRLLVCVSELATIQKLIELQNNLPLKDYVIDEIFKNWYFVTKIVLTYCDKKCSNDQETFLKFKDEGREFAKIVQIT